MGAAQRESAQAYDVDSSNAEPPWIGPLIETRPLLTAEYRRRKPRYEQKKIAANELEDARQAGWEKERDVPGGRLLIKKVKSADEQLENRLWCVLYNLGYAQLNKGRNFKIVWADNQHATVRKQIDVFGKRDSQIVVAECKANSRPTARSMLKDLGEFSSLKASIAETLKRVFADRNLSIVWLFVTKNVRWSDTDRARAHELNINVIEDKDLLYFEEISKNIGRAAHYQFLAEFLEGKKIKELDDYSVPAIRSKMGGRTVYQFLVDPERLLPISFVNHRGLRDPAGAPSYQRLVKRGRLKEIGRFIEGGGYFPNTILVNFKRSVRFDVRNSVDERRIAFGDLYLPNTYKSAWVIDGQHRLYGFTECDGDKKSHTISVFAFDRLDKTQEANLFATINGKQAKVSRNILDEIEGDLNFESRDPKQRIAAIASRVLDMLRSATGSPLEDRIQTPEIVESDETCLTVPELKKAIVASGLIGRAPKEKDKPELPGVFTRNDPETTMKALFDALFAYFEVIKLSNEERWAAGREGHLCINIGLAGYLRLLATLTEFLRADTNQDPFELDAEDVIAQVRPYLEPVLEFVTNASDADFAGRFKPKFGSGGPRRYYFELCALVNARFDTFSPEGLVDHLAESSVEVANLGDELAKDIVKRVHSYVIEILRKKYGADFFDDGISDPKIKTAAYQRQQEADKSERVEKEWYVDFIDLKKIVEAKENWELFESTLSIKQPDDRKGLTKYLSWFDRMNKLRRIGAHPGARQYKPDDITFMKGIREALEENGVP